MADVWSPVRGHEGSYEAREGRVRSVLDFAKCGTPGNYKAHRRRGEKACAACLLAEAQRSQDAARKRKERAATEREWVCDFQKMISRVNEDLNTKAGKC